jgi:(p)ppGpp synthase/HD superfamily hydrolase
MIEIIELSGLKISFALDFEYINKCAGHAIKAHADRNLLYKGKPYSYHLHSVAIETLTILESMYRAGIQYNQPDCFLKSEQDFLNMAEACIIAAYFHDTIEDAGLTYNDVANLTSTNVASIVFAVTNNTGMNRKSRADSRYYMKIRTTPGAKIVKLADRIANYKEGFSSTNLKDNRFSLMYKKEYPKFRDELYEPQDVMLGMQEIWNSVDELFEYESKSSKEVKLEQKLHSMLILLMKLEAANVRTELSESTFLTEEDHSKYFDILLKNRIIDLVNILYGPDWSNNAYISEDVSSTIDLFLKNTIKK